MKVAHVPLGLGQLEGAGDGGHCRRRRHPDCCCARARRTRISRTLPLRPPASAAASRRSRNPRRGGVLAGQESPRQGDVLELAQVVRLVRHRQPAFRRPRERQVRPALPDPDPGPHRGDGSYVGREVCVVDVLCLGEQIECAGGITVDLVQPGHGDPPAVPVLGQARVLAELMAESTGASGRAEPRSLRSAGNKLGHADVHVGRSPSTAPEGCSVAVRSPLLRSSSNRRRAAGPAPMQDVGQGDGAADDIPERCPLLGSSRLAIPSWYPAMRLLEVARPPMREAQQARRPRHGRGGRPARRVFRGLSAWAMVAATSPPIRDSPARWILSPPGSRRNAAGFDQNRPGLAAGPRPRRVTHRSASAAGARPPGCRRSTSGRRRTRCSARADARRPRRAAPPSSRAAGFRGAPW